MRLIACLVFTVGLISPGMTEEGTGDCQCGSGTPDLISRLHQDVLHVSPADSTGRVILDLFVMSLCPYGMQAERVIVPLAERFADRIELRLHYIATSAEEGAPAVGPGRGGEEPSSSGNGRGPGAPATCVKGGSGSGTGPFRSLHGQDEIDESLRQLVIREEHPDLFYAYLVCRARQGTDGDWRECAQAVGLDTEVVAREAAGAHAEELLRANITAAESLNVDLSPTLFIDGREYAGGFGGFALARRICARLGGDPRCAQVPVCGRDSDCGEVPGYVSLCEDGDTPRARCVRRPPVSFKLFVLNTAACPQCSTGAFLRATMELFPGAQVQGYMVESRKGAALARRYAIRAFPAYIFGPGFERTARFRRVRSMLVRAADGYVVAPRVTSVSYWPARRPRPGITEIFVPLWSTDAEARYLETLRRTGIPVRVHHLVPRQLLETRPVPALLAWRVCMAEWEPQAYLRTLTRAGSDAQDSWAAATDSLGAEGAQVRACVRDGQAAALLRAIHARADSLELEEDTPAALLHNQLLLRRAQPARIAALR